MSKIPAKIIFAGAIQNAELYLNSIFQNIENLSKFFSEASYIFIENDSTDNTKQLLKDWGYGKPNFHLISLDGLKVVPARTIRLEMIRNAYLETIRYYDELRDFNYLVIMDMDDVGTYLIDAQEVTKAVEFLEASPTRAAIFANQRGTYYDMWALRHSSICPIDIWEDVLDYAIKENCSDLVAFSQTFEKRIITFKESM